MATFTNKDGLTWKYGLAEATLSNIGAYRTEGPKRWVEIIANWTKLPAVADNNVLVDTNFVLDKGASIESVEIIPSVTFDSTSDDMTLSVGLVDTDGTSNYVKAALVDAATQTELNAGGENVSGWKGSAVLPSTPAPLTKAQKIMWEVDTHAASAGQAVVRIKWSQAPDATDTLAWSKS